jgi:hypothetical protein
LTLVRCELQEWRVAWTFVNGKTGAEVRWSFIKSEDWGASEPADFEIEERSGANDLVRWRLAHGKNRRRS